MSFQVFDHLPPANAVTACVGALVALIGYKNWRTAQDKFRLDLFNRRFDCYRTVLALEGIIDTWDDSREHVELYKAFRRSMHEARFLFPAGSGVHTEFENLNESAADLIECWRQIRFIRSQGEVFTIPEKSQARLFGTVVFRRQILENSIWPFLEFSSSLEPLSVLTRYQNRLKYKRALQNQANRAREVLAVYAQSDYFDINERKFYETVGKP